MAYYWTTATHRGETVVLSDGGFYEKIEDGRPKSVNTGNGYVGFATSDTPEIPASKSPEASLFAKVQSADRAGTFHVYQTPTAPDSDISNAMYDFGIIEEVRYTMTGGREVEFTHVTSVQIPEMVVEDIRLAYSSPGPDVWTALAERVKTGLASLISGGSYPSDLAEQAFESSQVSEYYDDFDAFMDGEPRHR